MRARPSERVLLPKKRFAAMSSSSRRRRRGGGKGRQGRLMPSSGGISSDAEMYSKVNGLSFAEFAMNLTGIEQNRRMGRGRKRLDMFIFTEKLEKFLDPTKDSMYPLLRLLEPEMDTRRTYGVQLNKLTDIFLDGMDLLGTFNEKNKHAMCLRGFQDPHLAKKYPDLITTCGDFGGTLRNILIDRGFPDRRDASEFDRSVVTLGWVNEQLDALCEGSSQKDKASVAKTWLRECTAEEIKWIARIILKDAAAPFAQNCS